MQLTVTVRDTDVALLKEIAEQQWRNESQQASALIEGALAAQRARAGGTTARRGRKPALNGHNSEVVPAPRGRVAVGSSEA